MALSRKAGLKHVTYLSVFKAHQFLEVPHFAAKCAVEEAIRVGGMPYTILRPGYFIQNERWLKPVLTGPGVYPIPAGSQGLAVVDVHDIAEAAAISLTEEGHKGKTSRRCRGRRQGRNSRSLWWHASRGVFWTSRHGRSHRVDGDPRLHHS